MDVASAPTITDWIGAISGIVAAVGGAGTLIIAIVLISKQHTSLTKTIDLAEKQSEVLDATMHSLADEAQHRSDDRQLLIEELEERRKDQARQIRLLPFRGWMDPDDAQLVSNLLARSGARVHTEHIRFAVTNLSNDRIRDVKVAVDNGSWPRCHVANFERTAGVDSIPVLPPSESARFYWTVESSPLEVYVEFTDANGARWRLHHRDGLSELTGKE
ncbi:hypothetical protein ACIRPH_31275 [Nocardiopsis sp. NPDC101807]|uniref:hypothetical protein n=1 Tax=Nocardiopsis sp. NPDC101807 TaxID=3364339 RepID=UPI0038120E1D